MPELPDVEVFGRGIREQGLHRRIETLALRDPDRLRGASPGELDGALRGYAFEAVQRHGKMLCVKVSSNRWLVMHFGMTGFVAFYNDSRDEPAHARLVIGFDDRGWFAFDDQRRFGWLELIDDVAAYLRSQNIGRDALSYDEATLRGLFADKHRMMVKTALMDQEKIAGIGNVYSDEILFQAGVRPDRKAGELNDAEVKAIQAQMRAVLQAAAESDADPAKMPHDWLTPHWGTDGPCPRCGCALTRLKVSGRTAYSCPHCQL